MSNYIYKKMTNNKYNNKNQEFEFTKAFWETIKTNSKYLTTPIIPNTTKTELNNLKYLKSQNNIIKLYSNYNIKLYSAFSQGILLLYFFLIAKFLPNQYFLSTIKKSNITYSKPFKYDRSTIFSHWIRITIEKYSDLFHVSYL